MTRGVAAAVRFRASAATKLTPTTMDIDEIIAGGGLVFPKASQNGGGDGKVKTKAKKKAYITGAHGSGAAKQKAKYRQRRANRNKRK